MNFLFNINVCRVCMQNEQDFNLLDDQYLLEMFSYATRLNISEKDNLPKAICSKCIIRLKIAHKFIQTAHESEKNLKSFLTKISNEFKEVSQGKSHQGKSKDTNKSIAEQNLTEDEMLSLIGEDVIPDSLEQSKNKKDENIGAKRKASPIKEAACNKIIKRENKSERDNLKLEQESAVLKIEARQNIKVKTVFTLCDDILLDQNEDEENAFEHDMNFIEEEEADEPKDETDGLADHDEAEVHPESLEDQDDEEVVFKQNDMQMLTINENISQTSTELHLEENQLHQNLEQSPPNIESIVPEPQETYMRAYESMLSGQVDELQYHTDYVEENSAEETSLKNSPLYLQNIEDTEEIYSIDRDEEFLKNHDDDSIPISFQSSKARQQTPRKESQKLSRFYCKQCNRDFSTKTNLNRHMLSHESDNKPYVCFTCSKSFSQKSTLKQHMYTHTGEKPYVCDVCNRGFTQCKSLIFHMRRHTGEKPFQCEYCSVTFRQKDALRMHILKYHVIVEQLANGNENYVCIICQTKFNSKIDFKIHMKIHTAQAGSENCFDALEAHIGSTTKKKIKSSSSHRSKSVASLESDNIEAGDAVVINVSASSAANPERAKKFQCRKCFKCFALKKSLIRHMSIHYTLSEEITECSPCDLQFVNSEDCQEHMIEHHFPYVEEDLI